MRAITLTPGIKDSACLRDVREPPAADGAILVRTLALGVCGTDREIVSAHYGEAPPGEDCLILGHESLGIVEEAPDGPFRRGDHVVGIVRRPDPGPCPACAAGEWDMCGNGRYTERGIKARHGFGAERFRTEPEFAVKVDPALVSRQCCWSRPALWQRHGTMRNGSGNAPAAGCRGRCSSRAPARSASWRR